MSLVVVFDRFGTLHMVDTLMPAPSCLSHPLDLPPVVDYGRQEYRLNYDSAGGGKSFADVDTSIRPTPQIRRDPEPSSLDMMMKPTTPIVDLSKPIVDPITRLGSFAPQPGRDMHKPAWEIGGVELSHDNTHKPSWEVGTTLPKIHDDMFKPDWQIGETEREPEIGSRAWKRQNGYI